jgi:hypothetical protein
LKKAIVIVARLDRLRQAGQDELKLPLHLGVWFDGIRQAGRIVPELYEATIIRVCNVIWYVRPRRDTVHCCGVGLSRVLTGATQRGIIVGKYSGEEMQVVESNKVELLQQRYACKHRQMRVGSAQQWEHPGSMTGLHGHQAPENMQVIS